MKFGIRKLESWGCQFFLRPMTLIVKPICFSLQQVKAAGTPAVICRLKASRLNMKLNINKAPWRTCFETGCIMTLQGHPRSLILALIESAYATSEQTDRRTDNLPLQYRALRSIVR